MKKLLGIALGIITSIGGFLDVGAIATSAEAGAAFGYRLVWALALGTLCVIVLVEMSGRLAAVSKHTLVDAVREHFGVRFHALLLAAELAIDYLVLAAEIGGVCLALQLVTGVGFRWWALPVAFAVWLLLWRGTFGLIENGVTLLGLVTVVFVAAAVKLQPGWRGLAAGLLPTLPGQDRGHYLFIAVSILGALISPYLFYFYSSGAREEKWDEGHLGSNRAIAVLGMGFGSVISLGVLIVAARVLQPNGIQVDRYEQVALTLAQPFGRWGFFLFAASLGIACFGAALEVGLDVGYVTAQSFGWNWGESLRPRQDARFSLAYTVFVFLAALVMLAGVDPLQLTLFSMALTAVILPLTIVPFLVLMNDARYLGEHRNGPLGNAVVIFTIGLAFLLALVAIPLELIAG